MRRIVFVLLLALARPASADEFFAPDKLAHFGSSFAWGALADTGLFHLVDVMGPVERTAAASALGLLPGLGVEIADELSSKYSFSWGDLAADAVGSVTGAITAELFNGQFFVAASNKQIKLVARW